jgi:hypothetical protein
MSSPVLNPDVSGTANTCATGASVFWAARKTTWQKHLLRGVLEVPLRPVKVAMLINPVIF